MKHSSAEMLAEYGGKIRTKYSGRYMNGKRTTAVIFEDERQFMVATSNVIRDAINDVETDKAIQMCDVLEDIHMDNMGQQLIFY